MAEKKTCVSCGKQIPSAALVCVFCSTKQPVSDEAPVAASPGEAPSVEAPLVVESSGRSAHATDPTLVGLKTADVQAALEAQAPPAAPPVNGTPAATRPTAAMAVVSEAPPEAAPAEPPPSAPPPSSGTHDAPEDERLVLHVDIEPSPAEAASDEAPIDPEPWGSIGRLVMGVGGLVLVALFFCPWHGVSSWQLLETFSGADFVRQLFYLTGGIVLTAAAILPLPFVFRAGVGTFVAALPVLLSAASVPGHVIDGWRGVVAALAVLALPATYLLRARSQTTGVAKLLVMAAVAGMLLLYLLPLPLGTPIALVLRHVTAGSPGHVLLGVLMLAPLLLGALALLGILGRDLGELGVLLAVLMLLWAPAAVAVRGLLVDDSTQLYVAVALLWASATAALSLAQLLSVAAARPPSP